MVGHMKLITRQEYVVRKITGAKVIALGLAHSKLDDVIAQLTNQVKCVGDILTAV